MSTTTDILEEIADEAKKLGIDVRRNTYPGATQEQLSGALKKLPFRVPLEVLELFTWRNGVRLTGQPGEIRIFPRFVWRSVELSVKATLGLVSASNDPQVRWQRSWFALLTDLFGDYYAVDADISPSSYGRIWSLQDGTDPFPAFWSFETMLVSTLECYKAGVFSLEGGLLVDDEAAAEPIYRRLNRGLSPYSDKRLAR